MTLVSVVSCYHRYNAEGCSSSSMFVLLTFKPQFELKRDCVIAITCRNLGTAQTKYVYTIGLSGTHLALRNTRTFDGVTKRVGPRSLRHSHVSWMHIEQLWSRQPARHSKHLEDAAGTPDRRLPDLRSHKVSFVSIRGH